MSTLRERNKRRAREDIQAAAVRLFHDRGFADTTVAAITEEAQVGRRTFLRYFSSKEDLALSLEDQDRPEFLSAFAARPASETPLEALREAMLASMALYDGEENRAAADRLIESQRLIIENPALHDAYMRREALTEQEIARLVASRLGTDCEIDHRPRLWAALFVSVTNVALAILLETYRPGAPLQAEATFANMFALSGLFGSDESSGG